MSSASCVPQVTVEPVGEGCPWCGGTRLRRRRPVDRCGECGHTFRNPSGVVVHGADAPPGPSGARRHRAAARALLPFLEAESWLDVGTGYGRFPEVAKGVHPYTSFDGLDATPRVERAQVAERVEEAHQGVLTDPEVGRRLRARYDVVSMLGHLENAGDPRAELGAASGVLRSGGYLLVEHRMARGRLCGELEARGYEVLVACRAGFSGASRVVARRS